MTARIGGIVASPVTPFTADNKVDLVTLGRLVDFLIRQGAHAVAMPMHMGESVSLSANERRDVARAGIEAAAGRVPVFINVSLSGTDEVIALARDAESIGARGRGRHRALSLAAAAPGAARAFRGRGGGGRHRPCRLQQSGAHRRHAHAGPAARAHRPLSQFRRPQGRGNEHGIFHRGVPRHAGGAAGLRGPDRRRLFPAGHGGGSRRRPVGLPARSRRG